MLTRRGLLQKTGRFMAALTIYQALPKNSVRVGEAAYGAVKTYADINVRSAAGTASALLATTLASGLAYAGGKITEATHTHTYAVTAEQIAQINAGQRVQLTSSQGSDGSGPHTVTIDPATLVVNGGTVKVFQSENGNLIGLQLGKGDQPFLYVEGTEGLDPATVKLCIGLAANCQDAAAFSAMELVTEIKERQVFSSINRINVQGESLVHVWATTQTGTAAKIVAKISK